MFPIGESLAIRNLEPAVSAGNGNGPPGRRSPRCGPAFDDCGSEYVAAFARCGSRCWSPRSPRQTGTARRGRRSPCSA